MAFVDLTEQINRQKALQQENLLNRFDSGFNQGLAISQKNKENQMKKDALLAEKEMKTADIARELNKEATGVALSLGKDYGKEIDIPKAAELYKAGDMQGLSALISSAPSSKEFQLKERQARASEEANRLQAMSSGLKVRETLGNIKEKNMKFGAETGGGQLIDMSGLGGIVGGADSGKSSFSGGQTTQGQDFGEPVEGPKYSGAFARPEDANKRPKTAKEQFYNPEKVYQLKYKLSNQSAETQSKVASVAEGFAMLQEMKDAAKSGYNPQYINANTTLIGEMISDDPFTTSNRIFTEVLGRLQSGGAINSEEEKRFNRMTPRAADTPWQRADKLRQMEQFITNKAVAFGYTKGDLGAIGFDLGQERLKNEGLLKQRQAQEDNLNPLSGAINQINNLNPNNVNPELQRLQELRAKRGY